MDAPPPWARAAAAMFGVGWGANQFASLLLAYRDHAGVSAGAGDALFGCYALGLIPALLIGGPLSDRLGRRALGRFAVVLSLVATIVLVLGVDGVGWLYAGRLLAGVASGSVFAPGTAWVKELSMPPWAPASEIDSGARRAAVALSAGFGGGPLVAGLISQWAPYPLVTPYVAHLVVIVLAGAAVWTVPETAVPHPVPVLSRIVVPAANDRRFLGVVAPVAPWVFTSAALSLTIGPDLVVRHTASIDVAFAGVVAGLTLGTGVLVQPLARRLDTGGGVRTMSVGLIACLAGCLVETATAATAQPALAVVAAVLLGAGYGTTLVGGLLETQRIAPPGELASLTAIYYALTYLGFAAPLVFQALTALAPYTVLLPCAAGVALLTLAVVRINARRTGLDAHPAVGQGAGTAAMQ